MVRHFVLCAWYGTGHGTALVRYGTGCGMVLFCMRCITFCDVLHFALYLLYVCYGIYGVLFSTVWCLYYCIVLWVWYGIVGIIWYGMVWYGMVWYLE